MGGITIDADNVTLDLNGHAITGTGLWDWSGIEVGDHDGVTILNRTVSGFGGGIVLRESDGNRLERVTLSDNHIGVVLFASSDSNDNVLRRNHFVANGTDVFGGGISAGITPPGTQASTGNLIERNIVLRNTDYRILVGLGNTVTSNVVIGNLRALGLDEPNRGPDPQI